MLLNTCENAMKGTLIMCCFLTSVNKLCVDYQAIISEKYTIRTVYHFLFNMLYSGRAKDGYWKAVLYIKSGSWPRFQQRIYHNIYVIENAFHWTLNSV